MRPQCVECINEIVSEIKSVAPLLREALKRSTWGWKCPAAGVGLVPHLHRVCKISLSCTFRIGALFYVNVKNL